MKLSSVAKYAHGPYDYMSNDNSSDSSESKDSPIKGDIKYATKPARLRKHYPMGPREEHRLKNTSYKLAAANKAKKFEVPEAEFDDSDSSSSSLSSPTKRFTTKPFDVARSSMKTEPTVNRLKPTTQLDRSYCRTKEEKYEKVVNAFPNRKKDMKRSMLKERPPQLSASHGKYRVGQAMFSPPVLKVCRFTIYFGRCLLNIILKVRFSFVIHFDRLCIVHGSSRSKSCRKGKEKAFTITWGRTGREG